MTKLSENAVRLKAYQLWEARGKPHGSDQDDWFAASEQLCQPQEDQPSAVQLMTEGVLNAASLAITAATQMVEGLFGATASQDKHGHQSGVPAAATAASPEPAADKALETAERKLQMETDKRVREAAVKAGVGTEPDKSKS